MSGQTKRVLVYTASLLIAPMPVMPFARGTREFVIAVGVCGAILALSSFYLLRWQMKFEARSLLGTRLYITSFITFVFGVSILVG